MLNNTNTLNTKSNTAMSTKLIQTYEDLILFLALKGYSLDEVKERVFNAFQHKALQTEHHQEQSIKQRMADLHTTKAAKEIEYEQVKERLQGGENPKIGHPFIGLILTLVGLAIPIAIADYLFPGNRLIIMASVLYSLISQFAASKIFSLWFDKPSTQTADEQSDKRQGWLSVGLLLIGIGSISLSVFLDMGDMMKVWEVIAYLVLALMLHFAINVFGFNENRTIHSIFQYVADVYQSFQRTADRVSEVYYRKQIIRLQKEYDNLAYDLGLLEKTKDAAKQRFLSHIELTYMQGRVIREYLNKGESVSPYHKQLADALKEQETVTLSI